MIIRKAIEADIEAVSTIYQHIHEAERRGDVTIGWDPRIYPRSTATEALGRDDLFVMETDQHIVSLTE